MQKLINSTCAMILSFVVVSVAHAADAGGVGFSRNRLIFPSSERAISLTVSNHGKDTQKDLFLVQASVGKDPTQKEKAPFVVTPPLFRLDADSENEMRIMPTGSALPKDRESVFYFAATVIPSTQVNGKEGLSQVTFATRTILKLFWRPMEIGMTQKASVELIKFINKDGVVVISNPTPYYQSFAYLSIDGHEYDINHIDAMVAPFGELRIAHKGNANQVTWQVMNDYGGTTAKKTQPVVLR
ncbi:fimbrial biogenesis chaperone [Enterobacter cloacae]|uniref:fimbrial biogenesis chaperone n=1 Tax=Enterobacter cloacae TaxID=550 RepID=UPI0013CF997A|nr:molecular chaperone [Enterobacter cloacae]